MSPTLFYQHIPTDDRIKIEFDDDSCPLYVATIDGQYWLDVSLIPIWNGLYHYLYHEQVKLVALSGYAIECQDESDQTFHDPIRFITVEVTSFGCPGACCPSMRIGDKDVGHPLAPVRTIVATSYGDALRTVFAYEIEEYIHSVQVTPTHESRGE